jgi:hypothetical protein
MASNTHPNKLVICEVNAHPCTTDDERVYGGYLKYFKNFLT